MSRTMKELSKVYVLHYGFDYEHDTIFGVYSSSYKANKAKRALIEVTEDSYGYYSIQVFILDEQEAVYE